jgi:hypothetical protein
MNEDASVSAAGAADDDPPEKKRRSYQPPRRTLLPELWTRERHPDWASREDVAVYEGVKSVGLVDAQLDRGDIKGVKVGDQVRIKVISVLDYFDRLPPREPRSSPQPRAPGAPRRKPGRKPKPRT